MPAEPVVSVEGVVVVEEPVVSVDDGVVVVVVGAGAVVAVAAAASTGIGAASKLATIWNWAMKLRVWQVALAELALESLEPLLPEVPLELVGSWRTAPRPW